MLFNKGQQVKIESSDFTDSVRIFNKIGIICCIVKDPSNGEKNILYRVQLKGTKECFSLFGYELSSDSSIIQINYSI